MSSPSFDDKLTVIARAPFHVYYDGLANSFSATNKVGDFSILPGHADFFSMLTTGKVEIVDGEEVTTFSVKSGLVTVRENRVYLFVNI